MSEKKLQDTIRAFKSLKAVIGFFGGFYLSAVTGLTYIFFLVPFVMLFVGFLASFPIDWIVDKYIRIDNYKRFEQFVVIVYVSIGLVYLWQTFKGDVLYKAPVSPFAYVCPNGDYLTVNEGNVTRIRVHYSRGSFLVGQIRGNQLLPVYPINDDIMLCTNSQKIGIFARYGITDIGAPTSDHPDGYFRKWLNP